MNVPLAYHLLKHLIIGKLKNAEPNSGTSETAVISDHTVISREMNI